MSTDSTTITTGGGNTVTPPSSMRRCCFTLNNYNIQEYSSLIDRLDEKNYSYIIAKEVGANGTPHLQGYVEFKSPRSFSTVKNLIGERAHIEKARGNRRSNIVYCSKDGDFRSTFPERNSEKILRRYANVIWKDWQQELITLHTQEPHPRQIWWTTRS